MKKKTHLDYVFDALHREEDLSRVRDLGVEQHVGVQRLHHRVGAAAERGRVQDRKRFVGLEGRPTEALGDVDGRRHHLVDQLRHDQPTFGCSENGQTKMNQKPELGKTLKTFGTIEQNFPQPFLMVLFALYGRSLGS